ncbi:MAG: hypothetical protein Kow0075_14020 [Salibacteraceae bacterium]
MLSFGQDTEIESCVASLTAQGYAEASAGLKRLYCQMSIAIDRAQYDSAASLAAKLDDMHIGAADSMLYAKSCGRAGTLYSIIEKYDEAIAKFRFAKSYFKNTSRYDELLTVLINEAEHYRNTWQGETALNRIEEAGIILEQHGPFSPDLHARYWHRYAALASQALVDPDLAIEYSQRSLSYSEPAGLEDMMATSYLEIGHAYYNKNELNKSPEYFQKALEIWRRLGMVHNEINAINNLARVYVDLNDLEKLKPVLAEFERLCEENYIPVICFELLLHYGRYFKSIGDFENAYIYIDSGHRLHQGILQK